MIGRSQSPSDLYVECSSPYGVFIFIHNTQTSIQPTWDMTKSLLQAQHSGLLEASNPKTCIFKDEHVDRVVWMVGTETNKELSSVLLRNDVRLGLRYVVNFHVSMNGDNNTILLLEVLRLCPKLATLSIHMRDCGTTDLIYEFPPLWSSDKLLYLGIIYDNPCRSSSPHPVTEYMCFSNMCRLVLSNVSLTPRTLSGTFSRDISKLKISGYTAKGFNLMINHMNSLGVRLCSLTISGTEIPDDHISECVSEVKYLNLNYMSTRSMFRVLKGCPKAEVLEIDWGVSFAN